MNNEWLRATDVVGVRSVLARTAVRARCCSRPHYARVASLAISTTSLHAWRKERTLKERVRACRSRWIVQLPGRIRSRSGIAQANRQNCEVGPPSAFQTWRGDSAYGGNDLRRHRAAIGDMSAMLGTGAVHCRATTAGAQIWCVPYPAALQLACTVNVIVGPASSFRHIAGRAEEPEASGKFAVAVCQQPSFRPVSRHRKYIFTLFNQFIAWVFENQFAATLGSRCRFNEVGDPSTRYRSYANSGSGAFTSCCSGFRGAERCR